MHKYEKHAQTPSSSAPHSKFEHATLAVLLEVRWVGGLVSESGYRRIYPPPKREEQVHGIGHRRTVFQYKNTPRPAGAGHLSQEGIENQSSFFREEKGDPLLRGELKGCVRLYQKIVGQAPCGLDIFSDGDDYVSPEG